jgi:hypothetical protein
LNIHEKEINVKLNINDQKINTEKKSHLLKEMLILYLISQKLFIHNYSIMKFNKRLIDLK